MITKELQNKLYAYFKSRLGMYDYTKGWIKGTCPSCGRPDKFGVHLGMYRTNCFVCGYHERPLYVVATVEDIPVGEVRRYLGVFEGYEYREPTVEEKQFKPISLPPGFKLLSNKHGSIAGIMRNYIKNKRGLDPDVLARKGFGYCIEGALFGYLIMPYHVDGRLVYYATRNVIGSGPKFDNPDSEEYGIGKSILIYNKDALYYYEHVFMVESIMNSETIGENSLALGGKKISKHQLHDFITSPCQRITIILDPDAWTEALQLALKLVNYKRVRLVKLPEGYDVNKLGHEKTMRLVYKQHYLTYPQILSLKHEYERSEASYSV